MFCTDLAAGPRLGIGTWSRPCANRRFRLGVGRGHQLDLGKSWRIGVDSSERTDLVTDGTFSVVRNPIFSAMSVFAVGASLAIGTRSAQLAAAAMLAAVQAQVRLIEEPHLELVHGDTYVEYCNAVGRFVPRLM